MAEDVINKTRYLTLPWKIAFNVIDHFIPVCPVPVLGPALQEAFWQGMIRNAETITVVLLFILTLLFGPEGSAKMTFGGLMKFVLIVFLFDILIDRKGYMAILALFQIVFAISLTNISNMKSSLALNYLRIILLRELLMPDWLPFAISVSAGIFGASILIGRFLKNPEESTNNVLKGYQLVSLEIFILILYGLLELQKPSNNIIAFAIRRVKRLLLGAWMNLHLWLEVGI
ncbi:MAG: hypothetical protein ACOC44_20735, partial [Promethearchaeia archaeon]